MRAISQKQLDDLGIKSIDEGINEMIEAGLMVEEAGFNCARLVDDACQSILDRGTVNDMFVLGVDIAIKINKIDDDE